MKKIIWSVSFIGLYAVSAQAYYYGSQGYSQTHYPGSTGSGLDSKRYISPPSTSSEVKHSASASATKVKKYCQGAKFKKDDCRLACSNLADSTSLSSEYAYEKNLCVDTQCAKSDSKSDGNYSTACGLACSEADDKNVKCVRRDIEKYCQNNYDATKCERYCAKAANKHDLCANKQYFKSFVEEEKCNKYCNRSSKNFSDETCKDKCGGMFDRYNTEEKNIEIQKLEEKDNNSNDNNNEEAVLNQEALAISQNEIDIKSETENISREIVTENENINSVPQAQDTHETAKKSFLGVDISRISFLNWLNGFFKN